MALIDRYSKEELEQIVSQSFSLKEVIDKLGYSTHSGNNNKTLKKRLKSLNISFEHFAHKARVKRTEENIFIENSTASQATLRKWYLKKDNIPYICSICGQEPLWEGKELTLILDHINGKNHDDRLENLRWICPNCNQQLETTGYKKKKNNKKIKKLFYCKFCGEKISSNSKNNQCFKCASKNRRTCEWPKREELKKLIKNYSFTKIAEKYHVSDNTIRKWCDKYNLPRRISDIKKISEDEWEAI